MAALTDSMGNTINSSIQELRAAMMGPVATSINNNTSATRSAGTRISNNSAELKKLANAMDGLKQVFQSDFKSTLDALNTAIGNLKPSSSSSSENDVGAKLDLIYTCLCKDDQDTDDADKTTFFMKVLKKEFKKPEFWKGLTGAMTDAGCCGGGKGGGDKPSGSPSPTSPSGDTPSASATFDDRTSELFDRIADVQASLLNGLKQVSGKFEKVFFNFGEKVQLSDIITGDLLTQEVDFAREIKKTAFEINNVTGEFKSAQKAYMEIGESVLETGVGRTKYQEEYLKNLRAGIRDEKKLQTITKQTLATESMLGLKAGELTDSFRELVLAGKMNSAQVSAMGRGMQEVSRNTGLTGENLKKAFEATKPFIKNLQNAASLTASSATNVMNVVAESQKLGVEDSVAPLLKSATSTVELIRNSSQEVQAFLYNAAGNVGKIQELQYGIITRSKKGMKDLAKGMEMVLQDFGVRSLEEVENLPDEVKFRLNLQLKGAFGMELGEMTRTIEAFKEAGKGVSDRLNEINAKRQLSLNMEEKAALAEQERQLKAKAAMDVLTGFSEAAKGAQSMDVAFSNFSRRAGDFREEIQAFGGDLGSMQGGLKSALTAATANLNEALKKQGEKEISIDASEIEAALKDKKQLNLLIDRIEAGNNKLQNATKAATDPTLMTARTLESYNDFFRNNYSAPLLQGILSLVGFSGIMATALTFIAADIGLSRAIDFKKYGKNLKELIFGKDKDKNKKKSKGGDGGPEVTCPVPSMTFDPKKLLKNAAQLAGLAVALGAMGAALLYLGSLVSDTVPNPVKTAVNVVTIIAAGAIIMTEAGMVLAGLYEADKKFGQYFTPQALGKASVLALKLSAAAIVFAGIAIGVLKIIDEMSYYSGIDAAKAYEISENVFAIGLAVGELTLGLVAALGIVIGVGAAMKALAAGMPFIYWFAGIGTFVLPIAAGALMLLGLGVIKVIDIMSYMAYPDTGQLEEAIEKIDAIVWATAKITGALYLASIVILGLGTLSLELPATLPLWAAAAYGIGVLAAISVFLVAVAWGLSNFFSYMSTVDGSDLAEGAENTYAVLNTINGVLLRLIPALVLIGAIGVGLGILKTWWPAAWGAIGPMMFWGTVLLAASPVIAAALTLLARAIVGLVTYTADAFALDPETLKKDMEKFDLILDTTYKILSKLAGLFGLIVGLSAGIGLLITFAPVVAGMMAAVAAVLVIALPAIAAGLVNTGIAIINAIKDTTKGFTLDKKEVEQMVEKIDILGNAISTVGAAVGKFAGKGIYQAAANISKFSTQIGSFISTLTNLKTATSGVQPNEMKDLASNLTSLMESTRAVFGIIAETQKFQITGALLGTGLQNANTTLTNSTGEIVLLIKNLTDLGQRVVLSTMQIDSKKVVESFKDIGNFTKSVEKFMSTVAKIKPNKNFKKNAKEMFMKSGLSEPLGDMLKEFKKVAEVQKTAGINRNDLIMTTELLTKVGDFTLNLTKAVENFEKSSKMLGPKGFLSKKNEYGDGETIKTNLVKIMETAKTIVSAMLPYATDTALGGQLGVAVAQMQEMGPIFEQLALASESFSKGAKKIAELTTTKGMWWWKEKGLITQMEQSVNTGAGNMTVFSNTLRVMFNSFKEIVKGSVEAKQTPQAMKDTATTLEQLKTAMSQFTTSASSFGGEMQTFFKESKWYSWTEGAGTFLSTNSEKINTGFKNTFSIIQNIKTTFDGFDVASSKSIIDKTNAAGQFAKDVASGLNYFTDSLYALNDLIKGGSQGAGWFGNSAKFPAYKFLSDDSVWNEYVKNFGSLQYVPMIFTHVTAGLDKGFSAFGNLSYTQLQKYFDEILKVVETLAKFPMAIKAMSDAVSTIATMTLPNKAQTDAVAAQSTPVTSMLTAFSSIVNALSSTTVDASKSQKALENVKNIDTVIMPLVNTLKSFEANIYTPVNTNTGMLSSANTKNMQDVGTAITGFLESFVKIMRAVDANGSLKESDFASTIVKIQQIASISTLLSSSLTTFSKELSLFNVPDPTTGVTKAQELTNSAKGIADALSAIGDLMTILKTTVNKVPGDEELTNISKKITALGGAATGIKDLFESVNKVMLILNDKQTFGNVSMIDGTTATLKEVVKSTGQNKIANMIQLLVSGIFAPLLNLKAVTEKGKTFYLDADDLDETSKIIKYMADGVEALAKMFKAIDAILIAQGELHKAGAAAGAAPATPGPVATDNKALNVAGSTFERLDLMLKEHSPTIAKIIQSVGGIMANFMSGPWANIDSEDVKEVGAVLSGVQSIFGMFSGDKSILTTINNALVEVAKLPQGAPEYEDGLQIPDGDEVLPPSFIQQVEGLAKFIGQLMDPISTIIFAMDNMGGKDVFIDSADIKEAGAMLSGISDMLTTLPQMIKTLSTELPNIMKEIPMINAELAKAGGNTPAEQGKAIANLFNNSFLFLGGLFANITAKFEGAQELNVGTETLAAIVPFTQAIVAHLPAISDNMNKIIAMDLTAFLAPPPQGVKELFNHVGHYAIVLIETNMPEIANNLSVAADGIENVGSNFENFYGAWQANVSNMSTKFNEIVAYDLTLATAVDYAAANTFFSTINDYVELLAYFDLDTLADNLEMAADTIPAVGFGISFLADVFADNMLDIIDSLNFIGSFNYGNMTNDSIFAMGMTFERLWMMSDMFDSYELGVVAENINEAAENIWNIDEAVTSLIEAYGSLMTSMSGLADISSMADVIAGLNFAATFSAAGQVAVTGGENAARQEVATRVNMSSSDLLDGAVAAATQATAENTSILVQQNDAIIGILQGMSSSGGFGGEESLPGPETKESDYNPSKFYAYANLTGSSVLGSPNFMGKKG